MTDYEKGLEKLGLLNKVFLLDAPMYAPDLRRDPAFAWRVFKAWCLYDRTSSEWASFDLQQLRRLSEAEDIDSYLYTAVEALGRQS